MNWKKIGIFALGTLFGLEGIKLLSSKGNNTGCFQM